jgi:uncharacterized protein YebE (UPF0316 family)
MPKQLNQDQNLRTKYRFVATMIYLQKIMEFLDDLPNHCKNLGYDVTNSETKQP